MTMRNLVGKRTLAVLFSLAILPTATATDSMMPATEKKALTQLLERARQTRSASVLVWQDGHELAHYYAGDRPPGPIELMSVTKSIVALGVGQLIATGKIRSLDQPVSDFYPEWRQGRKKNITIRMLMNHTSGLQSLSTTDGEIYPAPDAVQLALAAELSEDPGTHFFYNNKAVNLLAGIIEKASGERMDLFFQNGLFREMDIRPGTWETDRAGQPYVMSGLPLTSEDLAKLGQLVLDKGDWKGKRLLPANYVDAMLGRPNDASIGLLWWQVVQWKHFYPDPSAFQMLRDQNVPGDTVALLEGGLKDKRFESEASMMGGLKKILGSRFRHVIDDELLSSGLGPYRLFDTRIGPVVAYNGNGDGGQFLVVVPAARMVAVRQIDAESEQEHDGEDFDDFAQRVLDVAQAQGRLPPIPVL